MVLLSIDSFWGDTDSAQTWFSFIALSLSFLSVVGLLVTINIQTFSVRQQNIVNQRHIELLELQILEYSKKFMPKFTIGWKKDRYMAETTSGDIYFKITGDEPMYLYSVGLVENESFYFKDLTFFSENYHKLLTEGEYQIARLAHSDKFFWGELHYKNELGKSSIEIRFEIFFANEDQTRKFRTIFVYINNDVRLEKTIPIG